MTHQKLILEEGDHIEFTNHVNEILMTISSDNRPGDIRQVAARHWIVEIRAASPTPPVTTVIDLDEERRKRR